MAYTEEQIESFKELIIDGIANGNSLKSILENNKELPSRQTVYNWLNENHADYDAMFLDNYMRAREDSADLDADKVQEVADKTLTGKYDPAAARVAIDAFKWSAGVKKPKKYGAKVDLTSDGQKISTPIFGGNPLEQI